jgi:integral membrane protein
VPWSLTLYRVLAWTVGILLVVLVFVAVPMQVFAGRDTLVVVIGIAHGYLYMTFLVALMNLALRVRWLSRGSGWFRTVAVALAGTIPFLSFVAEHWVTKNVRVELAQPTAGSSDGSAGGSGSAASEAVGDPSDAAAG